MPGRKTIGPHQGQIRNPRTFQDAWNHCNANPNAVYQTNAGMDFSAKAGVSSKGPRLGQKFIAFSTQRSPEAARAYECCWGFESNCYQPTSQHIHPFTPCI